MLVGDYALGSEVSDRPNNGKWVRGCEDVTTCHSHGEGSFTLLTAVISWGQLALQTSLWLRLCCRLPAAETASVRAGVACLKSVQQTSRR